MTKQFLDDITMTNHMTRRSRTYVKFTKKRNEYVVTTTNERFEIRIESYLLGYLKISSEHFFIRYDRRSYLFLSAFSKVTR